MHKEAQVAITQFVMSRRLGYRVSPAEKKLNRPYIQPQPTFYEIVLKDVATSLANLPLILGLC